MIAVQRQRRHMSLIVDRRTSDSPELHETVLIAAQSRHIQTNLTLQGQCNGSYGREEPVAVDPDRVQSRMPTLTLFECMPAAFEPYRWVCDGVEEPSKSMELMLTGRKAGLLEGLGCRRLLVA